MHHRPFQKRLGDHIVATWSYINIKLFDLPAHDMIRSGNLGLLTLIPFICDADPEVIEQAANIVCQAAPPDQVGDRESLLALFSPAHVAPISPWRWYGGS